MNRVAPALLLLTAACSSDPPAPAPVKEEQAAPAPTPPASTPSRGTATGTISGLRGESSALTGTISGFLVERTDTGTRVQLAADTLFEFDKATLTPSAQANLTRTADLVRQGGTGPVAVTGYTDAKGDDAYNLGLSKRRAESVVAWLRGQSGLADRSFTAEGRGEADPVAPNARPDSSDDPDGRARNRRVTIDIPR